MVTKTKKMNEKENPNTKYEHERSEYYRASINTQYEQLAPASYIVSMNVRSCLEKTITPRKRMPKVKRTE